MVDFRLLAQLRTVLWLRASCLAQGLGVDQDKRLAGHFHHQAARKGSVHSMLILSGVVGQGKWYFGAKKSAIASLRWLIMRRAATQFSVDACYHIGKQFWNLYESCSAALFWMKRVSICKGSSFKVIAHDWVDEPEAKYKSAAPRAYHAFFCQLFPSEIAVREKVCSKFL
jgi:hypothetical protein